MQWASGEEFCQWDLLKHVLAVVVIEKLQTRFDATGSLPEYDYGVHMEVDQLPWLLDIYSPGSSTVPDQVTGQASIFETPALVDNKNYLKIVAYSE